MNTDSIQRSVKNAFHAQTIPLVAMLASLLPQQSGAEVTVFFDSSQVAELVATGTTSDTISSQGYLFTYTRDKLFTGGVGLTNPIGRPVRIPWPNGVEAQYVTAGPQPTNARITVTRVDGAVFDLTSFTARLLANAGAGRSIEIVPLLSGEEPLDNPLYFDVSGNYGQDFSYDTTPNYLGSTAALTNYDAYVINLTLDYALTALTLETPATNHAPTDIHCSNASVLENEPSGTMVGAFSTIDPDAGDTFTYTLVPGPGSEDNGYFSLNGGDLLTAASFNYEARSNYSIRVETTDQGLLSTQKVVLIDIVDVNEPAPDFSSARGPTAGTIVIQWNSLPNHFYTLECSTNLPDGFSVLQSNIPATPAINSYTDSLISAPQKFWTLTTDP